MRKILIFLFILLTLIFSKECEILNIYGSFEEGKLTGWEKIDGRCEYKIVEDARDGKYALNISAKEAKYFSPGIKINPDIIWDTKKSLKVSFSIKFLQRYNGYFVSFYLKGKPIEKEKPVYRFYYFIIHSGEKEFNLIKEAKKVWGWDNEKERLNAFEGIMPNNYTFLSWIGKNVQTGSWDLKQNIWFDFEFDLKDSLNIEGKPEIPEKIEIFEVGFLNYIYDTTNWIVDNVKLKEE
ncbi:MAG: hypothetical protein NC926_02990 [Candidatus Omnitrophica bacterium]|nr:hypothetical protein [Candidatus Omnitrophota bacterium]